MSNTTDWIALDGVEALRASDSVGHSLIMSRVMGVGKLNAMIEAGDLASAMSQVRAAIDQIEAHTKARPDAGRYLAYALLEWYVQRIIIQTKIFGAAFTDPRVPLDGAEAELRQRLNTIDMALGILREVPPDTFGRPEGLARAERVQKLRQFLIGIHDSTEADIRKVRSELAAPAPAAKDKRCFIATAAYPPNETWKVDLLRRFRDVALLPHATGRVLVGCYYVASPPLADIISRSARLRAFVRRALDPIVRSVGHYLSQHDLT